ncbi:hypothetical protein [Actinoplanes aureus]|uniref:Major facilitator superfamily (MFS) profile domain-containing protein n=1 Tax=Actinoplanes aureus TaxID=2792083 RepID=A0A931FWR6_9ACTN|nr:hypothetical protein [Actinoplanes aureus]MBG0561660.1 hypothetical protein [Actinoplanes aureus]
MTSDTARGTRAIAGFGTAVGVLLSAVLVFAVDVFEGRGWRDGEYVYLFVVFSVAALVLGGLLAVLPQWRSFGKGLAMGGLVGVLVILAGIVLFFFLLVRDGFVW